MSTRRRVPEYFAITENFVAFPGQKVRSISWLEPSGRRIMPSNSRVMAVSYALSLAHVRSNASGKKPRFQISRAISLYWMKNLSSLLSSSDLPPHWTWVRPSLKHRKANAAGRVLIPVYVMPMQIVGTPPSQQLPIYSDRKSVV